MSVATRPVELTARQREILLFIAGEVDAKGLPPTMREIGAHFGIKSPHGVSGHLEALERKGWIARQPNLSRALRILRRPRPPRGTPAPMPPAVRSWLESSLSPGLVAAIHAELAGP